MRFRTLRDKRGIESSIRPWVGVVRCGKPQLFLPHSKEPTSFVLHSRFSIGMAKPIRPFFQNNNALFSARRDRSGERKLEPIILAHGLAVPSDFDLFRIQLGRDEERAARLRLNE